MRLKLILDQQSDDLKAHALSVHRTLTDLVKTEFLNLSAFIFYDRNGNVAQVDLSHKGDYLLDFWFVQCPPCVRDHKKIVKHLDLFTNNNVELIGISIDTESDKWLNYLETNHYNWLNYRELGSDNDLVEALDVWEFPTYVLVTNTGEIKTKFYAFEELEHYFSKP
jgi:peroxiredoxin